MTVDVRDDQALVRIVGELDADTATVLGDELSRLEHIGVRRYTLDMAGVELVDSTGLKPIVRLIASHRAERVALASVPAGARQLIDLIGLTPLVTFIG